MKFPFAVAFGTSLLVAGCTSTTPVAPAPSHAAKTAPTPAAKAASPAAPTRPEAARETKPTLTQAAAPAKVPVLPISPAAAAVVERLTQSVGAETQRHELAETSHFPEAAQSLQKGAQAPKYERLDRDGQPPASGLTADGTTTQLVDRDWTGLVLVPIATSLSKLHTSDVRLLHVEAHPLNDGRVRIWARIQNVNKDSLPAEVACIFRMRGAPTPTSPYFYSLQVPGLGYRDVFFISPDGDLNAYTVLVRSRVNE
jgi:hypothetical protein